MAHESIAKFMGICLIKWMTFFGIQYMSTKYLSSNRWTSRCQYIGLHPSRYGPLPNRGRDEGGSKKDKREQWVPDI